MYQDLFLPVVFELGLSSDQPSPVLEWKQVIFELLQHYIKQLCEDDKHLIGHVKALAVIDEQDYLKYSCTNNSGNIDIQHQGSKRACSDVSITINSLVAEIGEPESRQTLEQACHWLKSRKELNHLKIKLKHEESQMNDHHHAHGEDCPICSGHHH